MFAFKGVISFDLQQFDIYEQLRYIWLASSGGGLDNDNLWGRRRLIMEEPSKLSKRFSRREIDR